MAAATPSCYMNWMMRGALLTLVYLVSGCGGGVDEATQPSATAPSALVEVSGTVTLISGRWPSDPVSAPAARRIVLVRPGSSYSKDDPRLANVKIIADTVSAANGGYTVRAAPGSYLIYVVDSDNGETLNNDSMSGINGSGAELQLEDGVPVKRDLIVNRYFRG